jgi:hypothetical protein
MFGLSKHVPKSCVSRSLSIKYGALKMIFSPINYVSSPSTNNYLDCKTPKSDYNVICFTELPNEALNSSLQFKSSNMEVLKIRLFII